MKYEAVFVKAICGDTGRVFYIRFDKAADGATVMTYGLTAPESSSSSSSISKVDFSNFRTGPQYKCPHCGKRRIVHCSCGGVGCLDDRSNSFHCASCGSNGTINRTIYSLDGNSGKAQ